MSGLQPGSSYFLKDGTSVIYLGRAGADYAVQHYEKKDGLTLLGEVEIVKELFEEAPVGDLPQKIDELQREYFDLMERKSKFEPLRKACDALEGKMKFVYIKSHPMKCGLVRDLIENKVTSQYLIIAFSESFCKVKVFDPGQNIFRTCELFETEEEMREYVASDIRNKLKDGDCVLEEIIRFCDKHGIPLENKYREELKSRELKDWIKKLDI